MTSYESCTLCSRPLTDGSAGSLCAICLARTSPPSTAPVNTAPDHRTGPAGGWPDRVEFLVPAGVATADPPAWPRSFVPEAPPGFELVARLGGGGMGEVYLAREAAPQRAVAIKFLLSPAAPGAYARFLAEVRALSRLDHPNIVRVLAVEPGGRDPYFTMEYVRGGTLADLVRDGAPPVPPAEAARLMLGAAEAVAAAHAADVVHRDIKPSNILLANPEPGTRNPEPKGTHPSSGFEAKVSDFGLAKRTDLDEELTKTGPIGTAAYMSPEAATGRHREVGVAADVYGLGATLYHLLTGRPPFRGRDRADTMLRVVRDPLPRPRAARPDLPPALEAVVVKAMEKDPARRYASARELADDLRRFLAGEDPVAPVLSPGRRLARWAGRNRGRIALAAVVLLASAGLLAVGQYLVPLPEAGWERARSELQAGRGVVLIPALGPPLWSQCVVGPATIGPDPYGSGAAAFESFEASLIELLPDPGIDRYRVTAEVRVVRGPQHDKGPHIPLAGLYFGRVEAEPRVGDRSPAQSFLAVAVYDYIPPALLDLGRRVPEGGGTTDGRAEFRGDVVTTLPGQEPETLTVGGSPTGPIRFAPAEKPPGRWWRVEVEVTPERVRVFWGEERAVLADLDADRLAALTAARQAALDGRHPGLGATLPPWRPRLPLGVVCQDGTAAVRNVTVEPLP